MLKQTLLGAQVDGAREQRHYDRMPKRKDATPRPEQQHRVFVKAARELGADEREEAFDKVLKRVAKAPPPKTVQKRKAPRRRTRRG